NESYNQTLSEKRAQNVANVFIQAGYKQQNIQTFGRGSSQPLVQNNSNENRAINRRVNVVIIP
ncbi:MAG: OmpA family protein, partial [Akkermansia sp.]